MPGKNYARKIEESVEESLVVQARMDGIERLVVGAVIVRGGKVLLLRRKAGDFMEGIYELPSGVLEGEESLVQALVREVKEETALEVVGVVRYLGSFDYLSGSGRPTRQFSFEVSVGTDNDVRLSEHDSYLWAGVSDLEEIQVSREVRQILETVTLEGPSDGVAAK